MAAMFTRERDVSLVRSLNRELMGNIITQQAAIYKFKLEETKVNLYGEAAGEKYYDGSYLFNCLISRQDQAYPITDESVGFSQGIQFNFFRDDLVDADVVVEIGDIILYQERYYGIESTVANQYWGGKNPDYPNNNSDGTPNPVNPDLDQFGTSVSILVNTYAIPADKVAISPYKERF